MKKRNIILIAVLISLALIGSILLIINYSPNNSNITITQYSEDTFKPFKKININSNNDIKKIDKYVKELKPLTDEEMVNLAILKDIEIKYYDNISITISLEEKDYCCYTDKKNNITAMSKMPKGLYEWVERQLKI